MLDLSIAEVHQGLNGFIQFCNQIKLRTATILSYFIQVIKMVEYLHLDPSNGLNNRDGKLHKTFLYLMLKSCWEEELLKTVFLQVHSWVCNTVSVTKFARSANAFKQVKYSKNIYYIFKHCNFMRCVIQPGVWLHAVLVSAESNFALY